MVDCLVTIVDISSYSVASTFASNATMLRSIRYAARFGRIVNFLSQAFSIGTKEDILEASAIQRSGILFQQKGDQISPGEACVMLVVHGDGGTMKDVIEAIRCKWAVIVFRGTGGLADAISEAVAEKNSAHSNNLAGREAEWDEGGMDLTDEPTDLEFDPEVVQEIISEGNVDIIDMDSDKVEEVTQLLVGHVANQTKDNRQSVMLMAWRAYGELRLNAERELANARCVAFMMALLSFVTTAVAVTLISARPGRSIKTLLLEILSLCAVFQTILATITHTFLENQHLSGAAEAIKSAIMQRRAQVGIYQTHGYSGSQADAALAWQLRYITQQESSSNAVVSVYREAPKFIECLWLFSPEHRRANLDIHHPDDDALSILDSEEYLRLRLDERHCFFSGRAAALTGRIRTTQFILSCIGAVNVMLLYTAAFEWVALTASAVTAIQSIQVEQNTESEMQVRNSDYCCART
jgi:hypothetical protein